MAPNNKSFGYAIPRKDIKETDENVDGLVDKFMQKVEWKFSKKDLIWTNIISIIIFHIIGAYGFLTFPYIEKFRTFSFGK